MSLFQIVFSSEPCMSLGTHAGAFFTVTCSVEVPYSLLKPIDSRCSRSLPRSISRPRVGHFRSPNWLISEPLVTPFCDRIYKPLTTSSVLYKPPPVIYCLPSKNNDVSKTMQKKYTSIFGWSPPGSLLSQKYDSRAGAACVFTHVPRAGKKTQDSILSKNVAAKWAPGNPRGGLGGPLGHPWGALGGP